MTHKAKLHETLAVEADLANIDKKLQDESIRTFGKQSLFQGQLRKLKMFGENMDHLDSVETQELTTVVDENLDYLVPRIAAHWDVVAQKDATNQIASACIIIDGVELTEALPATTLLGLEAKLSQLRKVYEAIPTLAPGIKWEKDESRKAGVFIAEDVESNFKTEQAIEPVELSPATKEHPAQVQAIKVMNNIGKYTITRWSGMFTPLEKANRLERLDTLRGAVKRARMRANTAEVVSVHVGEKLLNFINGK